jgi:tetratricopeptide (TPR) repeat protein
MSLWQGDAADALRRAAAAPGREGEAGQLRIRGQLALARENVDQALADLSASLALHDTPAARVSLAEALIHQRRWDPAHEALSRATAIGDGYLFVAWILRFLAAAGERPAPDSRVHLRQIEEFAEALAEIAPDGAAALADGRQAPLVAAADQALARMGYNRSPYATYHDGHVLRRVSTRTGVRHASRQALQAIRSEPAERVRALFDAVIARWPRSSLPLAHRGELHLWLGDDARAGADLTASLAISDRTRWAYVGLTLLSARTGDPAEALRISEQGIAAMRGTVGPAVYAHRAMARRRLGDLAGALDDLRRAVALHPTRIGAQVELALGLAAAGDLPGLSAVFDELRARAPGLISDAAAELGLHAWEDMSAGPGPDDQIRIAERALVMLRGNRSSTCVTYFTAAGRLRTVPHGPAPPTREADDLAGARDLVLRSLGLR